MATGDKTLPTNGKPFKSGNFGGKTQEDLKKMGRTRAVLAAQKRGKQNG